MKDFIINLICGSLGGLLVYYVQIVNEKNKKKNHIKEKIEDSKKTIPKDFIYSVHIGISMTKIEEIIGLPLFSHTIDENELFGNDLIVNINEYRFENCLITIIHQNSQLSAIIISSYQDSKIELIKPDAEIDRPILGKFCVDGTFDNENNEIIHEISIRDSWFGIIEYHGRFGGYNCYYGMLHGIEDLENLKIEQFKGEIIEAFGLSSNPELFKYYSSAL
ncbi:hypothetical protein [Flavobacterium caseinilyticum]|uniref:Uncharacterized protein n=1 Tax=Flavobacterium caseinilyticum TaxID=2541732 RepID=A0A4V2YUF6_9FLAO|nr:hypothetical protein [Flavobacterium caseinilyticum]TDD77537.1 hypothetical protein E0F89_08120 [Flavobacterium caseinilyticum]